MQQPTFPGALTSTVSFGNRVNAFLALPENGNGPFGAVILGHERYGLVQHTLDLTAKFAASGYVAVAPNLFSRWDGDMEALNRGDITVPLSDGDIVSYMSESLNFLLDHPMVDANRIAVMGVCQSGAYPLLLNRARSEVAVNIVVYGGAQNREWELNETKSEPYEDILARISAPVLGMWGEDDFVVSVDNVARLRGVLEANRKSYEFKLFRDMLHGWMNSTVPGRYRLRESELVWQRILDFMERVYAGDFPKNRVIWRFDSDIDPAYDFTKKVRLA